MTPESELTFKRLQMHPSWHGACAYCVHHALIGNNDPCCDCKWIDDINADGSKLPDRWIWHEGSEKKPVGNS